MNGYPSVPPEISALCRSSTTHYLLETGKTRRTEALLRCTAIPDRESKRPKRKKYLCGLDLLRSERGDPTPGPAARSNKEVRSRPTSMRACGPRSNEREGTSAVANAKPRRCR